MGMPERKKHRTRVKLVTVSKLNELEEATNAAIAGLEGDGQRFISVQFDVRSPVNTCYAWIVYNDETGLTAEYERAQSDRLSELTARHARRARGEVVDEPAPDPAELAKRQREMLGRMNAEYRSGHTDENSE